MRIHLLSLLTMLIIFAPGLGKATTLAEQFHQANAALAEKGPDAAWGEYMRLWEDFRVESPSLFYNAGIAATRAEKLGSAVWCFEKALAHRPTRQLRKDSETNLEIVRGLLRERLRLKGSSKQVNFVLTPDPWRGISQNKFIDFLPWIAMLFGLIGAFLLSWRIPKRSRDRIAGILFFSVFVGGMSLTWFLEWNYVPQTHAVIVSSDNPFREGSHSSANVLPVQVEEGQMVLVIDGTHPEFVRVELPNGKHGWLDRAHVKEI